MTADLEKLYSPRATVHDWQQIIERWHKRSAEVRKSAQAWLDVPYGTSAAETLDIFPAEGRSRGLLMFIHGGYWRALDKSDHSFIAPAFTRAGLTVAIPNYALCPAVTVEDIVRQMLQAAAWLYRNGGNFGAPLQRLCVAGHSAGGHLTAMTLAAQWPVFAGDLPRKIVRAGICMSGLYDLAPLVKVSFNADVRLTPASARKLSPALMPPATDAPLYTAVAAEENEGFHIQQKIIGKAWASVHKKSITVPGAHHFSILERFIDPASELHRATLQAAEV